MIPFPISRLHLKLILTAQCHTWDSGNKNDSTRKWKGGGRFKLHYVVGSGTIDPLTIQSDFRSNARGRLEIAHFDHGFHKLVKEGRLVGGESSDDGCGISPGGWEQLLVTLEKPPQADEIGVIGLVESSGCDWIEIHSCLLGCTLSSKLLPVCWVKCGVGSAGVVEVVEAVTEEEASWSAERVGSW